MNIDKFKKLIPTIPKRGDKERHIVALDIGTEFVKVLIGRVVGEGSDRAVEIIGMGREHQGLNDMHSGAISDIAGVVENCEKALARAEEMAGVTARDTVIGIAGELVKGSTTTINYQRPEPEKTIELKELQDIIEQVQTRALERARAELSFESGVDGIEVKMVNAAVVSVEIDGYKVTNPLGFQGKDVAVQLFCAFAPMVHIGALERVALDLDLNLISVTAEPFAVAKSVGADQSETFSAIFIDVGGGTTDIALVHDGGVEGTKMFGIGGRSFTKTIARTLGITYEEAEKRKLELSSEPKDSDVRKALIPNVKVWLSGVELALSEFDNIDQLPSKILLCGGGSGLPYVPRVLQRTDWRKNLPLSEDLTVNHIDPSQVQRVSDKTGKVDDYSYITPMGLLNVGLDTITIDTPAQKFINKLNQALQS